MSTKRMLVDASHPEETRVVVLDGTKLEGYDVEVASRRQLKGNIYLAKVTRVEPSLQAAFVEYGGNRHGFLAFNEIHPDYYQIPVADRQALLAEQNREAETAAPANGRDESEDDGGADGEPIEVVGGDDDEEMERRPPRFPSRHYKIQEVIKRRQILLVQVVKEERGNKGAALTTYLSLAGRYCVLMPNTSRGGGISRKISSLTDRKRLKKILTELEVPDGMGVIVRTAGSGRTKAEIKRDYEYLMRLWSNIRETTLSSIAPALVYEEASLIKRSIRDLYGRDTEEIVIQGEPEYRIAKEFMKLFIPSHAKRVKLHDDTERPLFSLYQVESQLDAMHLPSVPLKSGGYIVINPTEALVSIDVNSGRATRERHIEETALRTNIEAADEVARQVRLRDLAGLIVIDFIDMENSRNQGQVERRVKDAMKMDRARIQLGRISAFGLLELSRQRLRPSLLETSFETCPYCSGMGVCRTTESTVLSILRKVDAEGQKAQGGAITVTAAPAVAMYLLNNKRKSLAALEGRFQLHLIIAADATFAPAEHHLERVKGEAVAIEAPVEAVKEPAAEADDEAATEVATATADGNGNGDEAGRRSRRRRPRRRRRTEEDTRPLAAADETGADKSDTAAGEDDVPSPDDADDVDDAAHAEDAAAGEGAAEGNAGSDESTDELSAQEAARKRRRRGKRGGRRRPRRPEDGGEIAADGNGPDDGAADGDTDVAADAGTPEGAQAQVAMSEDPAGPDVGGADDTGADAEEHPEFTTTEFAPTTTAAADGTDELDETQASGGAIQAESGNGEDHEFEVVSYPMAEPEATDDRVEITASAGGEVERAANDEASSSAGDGNGHGDAWTTRVEASSETVERGDADAELRSPVERADEPASDRADDDHSDHAQSDHAQSGHAQSGHDHSDDDQGDDDQGDEDPAAAARTEVIHVGAGGDVPGAPRRGWWQRFIS